MMRRSASIAILVAIAAAAPQAGAETLLHGGPSQQPTCSVGPVDALACLVPPTPSGPPLDPIPSAVEGAPCAPAEPDRCEAWIAQYDGPAHGADGAGEGYINTRVIATSPDESVVYVAGRSDRNPGESHDYDGVVLALEAATGRQVWVTRFRGADDVLHVAPLSVAAGADAVYVTARFVGGSLDGLVTTTAFGAQDGHQMWTKRFPDYAYATDYSARENLLFATGVRASGGDVEGFDAVTIAYDGSSGEEVWTRAISDPDGAYMLATRVALSGDGNRLAVVASRLGEAELGGRPTTALVVRTYDLDGNTLSTAEKAVDGTIPAGLVLDHDGSRAYAIHTSVEGGPTHYLVVAFDTVAGTALWTNSYIGATDGYGTTHVWYYDPIALSPDGDTLYATGFASSYSTFAVTFDTVAVNTANGQRSWVARYPLGRTWLCLGCGPALTVTKDGDVVVAGDLAVTLPYFSTTVAYDENGGLKWSRIYRDGRSGTWESIISSKKTNRVFLAGSAGPLTTNAESPWINLVVTAYDV